MASSQPSVLLIASDTIGPYMAGSGVRYWNLARTIGAHQPVTLAAPNDVTLAAPTGVTIQAYGNEHSSETERGTRLAELVGQHDVVVAQHLPYLYTDASVLASRHLVVDLYAPWILEKLEYARIDPARGEPDRKDDVTILNRLLQLGDFFLCASERQRDFWLGALASAGRLTLPHAQSDADLRTLIDVVGFGLPDKRPLKTGGGAREHFPTIGPDDPMLLWNGGIWNWLDPLTTIRAVARLSERIPNLRLVFMGTRSPGAHVADMSIIEDAQRLAAELGLLNLQVFFNDWVAFEERQNWLLEANATISLHVATIEARYAFRTRMLDNLWCGVPPIVTAGDVMADLVSSADIGETAPPGDEAAVADAIERVLDRDRSRQVRVHLAAIAQQFTWDLMTEPLLAFCRHPRKLGERAVDPHSAYLHDLERLYTDTAAYARHLEATVADKDHALEEFAARARVPGRRSRQRPDLGALFRRDKHG